MITNERELRAAQEWIDYWKSTRTGAQSWIGNEQASKNISKLKREIEEYRRKADSPHLPPYTAQAQP